jgi:hypothetical protein
MPKKKRGQHAGRGGATKARRARQGGRSGEARPRRTAAPDLLTDVRRALSDEHPFGLLALVSALLAVVDPRRHSPFDRVQRHDQPQLSREELVRSFLGMPCPETSALLAVIAELAGDDLLRARIRRELTSWPYPLPTWVADLPDAVVYRTVEMVHVLRDGDNVMLGARMGGHELTCAVYIDHNLGTLVKDAFVVPESIAELVAHMRSSTDDPDTSWDELNPADARVRVSEAIYLGAMTVPLAETDTWPACRPLVEWLIGLLPEGGTGYQRPDWDAAGLTALSDRFFASSHGAGLDDGDHRRLLDSLLWFGTDYGPGDPLRWSPVSVEILLADWIPRKIVADAAYLAKTPRLLRAFIRFCHAEVGVRSSLTAETVAAVDRLEPEYQRIIRSPRLQGPQALMAAMGFLDPDEHWPISEFEEVSIEEIMLDTLGRAVGGDEQLEQLDDHPLPDEPFAWEAISDDIRDRVAEVVALVDRCCDEQLGGEYRTACRRFLARVAAGDPDVFRRRGRADTAAAAVVLIIGKANELFANSAGGRGMLIKDLMNHFGLKQSGVTQRASTLLRAGGFDTDLYGSADLGSPDYLISSRRRHILELRDRYRAVHDS